MQIASYIVEYPSYDTCRPCTAVLPTIPGVVSLALSTVGKTMWYTQLATPRWAGINSKTCPGQVPASADCSSFVTWLYWYAGWGHWSHSGEQRT